MRPVKLTSIPPANRRQSPGGGIGVSAQPNGRTPSRVIRQAEHIPMRAGLIQAVEKHIEWIQEQIKSAEDERERSFWKETLQRLLGETV